MSKISEVKVYHRFDTPKVKGLVCDPKEGRTHQSFKDETNVNFIVDRYAKTGLWGSMLKSGTSVPLFGDFTNVPDFVESMQRIAQAHADFDALPSKLRKRFNNRPEELLEFLSDKNNRAEAEALGLVNKAAPGAAAQVDAAPSAESPKAK